jgi:hypothetical protein
VGRRNRRAVVHRIPRGEGRESQTLTPAHASGPLFPFHPLLFSLCRQTPLQTFWPAVIVFISILEVFSVFSFQSPFGGEPWSIRTDYEAGDLGFDPLGLKPTTPTELAEMQTKELNNGRLAMIAIGAHCCLVAPGVLGACCWVHVAGCIVMDASRLVYHAGCITLGACCREHVAGSMLPGASCCLKTDVVPWIPSAQLAWSGRSSRRATNSSRFAGASWIV